MFWKLTTVKILVYTVKTSCVILVLLKWGKIQNENDRSFFPVAGL